MAGACVCVCVPGLTDYGALTLLPHGTAVVQAVLEQGSASRYVSGAARAADG